VIFRGKKAKLEKNTLEIIFQNFPNFFVGKLPNFAKEKHKTLVRTRRVDF
jgi:hypothetical protein